VVSKIVWRALGLIAVTGMLLAGLTTRAEATGSYNTNELSYQTPALAVYNGAVYMAWQSTDPQKYLTLDSATAPGYSFGTAHIVASNGSDELTQAGPALAVYNGKLWIAWTSTDPQHTINLAYTTNGTTFSTPVLVGDNSTNYRPALTAFGGKLYIAWTGTDPGHHLNLAYTTDGITFGDAVTLGSNGSNAGPSIGTFGTSTLMYAWAGTDGANTLNFAYSTNGSTFGSQTTYPNQGSSYGPAIVWDPTGALVFLAWTGTNSVHDLNTASSLNGTTFGRQDTDLSYSYNGPAVATDGTQIFIAWTATDSKSTIDFYYFTPAE
jgi:hypothetical protein